MPIKVHKFAPRQKLPTGGGLFHKYRRVFDDDEYQKLVAEQGQTIAELGEDTIETVGANLYEGTKATPEAMYQTGTELYEFGAELFGAGEDTMYDARQARRAAQELSAQTKQELVGGLPGGGISEFGYELGSTATQEIPFMIGSAGVGTVAKKAGQKIVKNKIRQRLGQEALEAAPDTFVGKAVGKAIQDQTEKIGTRAAISSMAAIHGARSTSGTFGAATDKLHEDYSKALKAQNPDMPWQEIDRMAYEQARADAVAPAIASGVITAGLISAFGATGVERFFANPTKSRPVFQEFLSAFGLEATEEGADQFLQGVLAKHSYDPSRSWDSIMAETAHAGLLGGTIGVKLGGTKILAERGVDFYQNRPITKRLAAWAERRAGARVKDKEGLAKWIEDHTDTSGTEAKEAATAIASATDQIKARLNKESQGASEREAKSEAAQEQRPTEEELDQREEQGEDVTVERDVAEELNQHKARGRAAAEDKVENPEEIASQIEEEDSIEAAEKFVEGYNEVAIKEETEQEEFRSEDLDQDYFDTFPGAEEEVTTEQSAVTREEFAQAVNQAKETARTTGRIEIGSALDEVVEEISPDEALKEAVNNITTQAESDDSSFKITKKTYSPEQLKKVDSFQETRDEKVGRLSEEEITEPVLIFREDDGSEYIVNGNHRYRAAVKAGKNLDVVVYEKDSSLPSGVIQTEGFSKTDPNQGDFFGLMLAPAAEQIATKDETEQADVENDSLDLFDQAQQQVANEDRDVFGPPVEEAQRELDLTELEEGEERGRVDVPQRPLGPPAPDPQRELVAGEETEPDFTTESLEAKEAPKDQFVLSIERPSKSRLSHYKKADGYHADKHISLGKNYSDNGREAIVKHNQNTKSIDIGFINEQGRFIPTHRLKDYAQVKESNQKRGNSQQPRAYFIPKQLLSNESLANLDVWELAPRSPIQAKFSRAQAAQVGESEMARRIVSHVSDPALRETLQLMLANDQLGVESVNALILAAKRYKPEGARGVNPRTLSDAGNVEELAKQLEQSISLLRDKNLFSETIRKGDAGFTEEAVNSLVAGLEARTDLTVDDLKLVDKGRADEEFEAADFDVAERGFRASVQQSNENEKSESGLAPLLFKTSTESKGKTSNRIEVGLVNPERIPLAELEQSLNEALGSEGIKFEINKTGEPQVSVSGDAELLNDDAIENIRAVIAYVNMKAKKAPVNEKYAKAASKKQEIDRAESGRRVQKKERGVYTPGKSEEGKFAGLRRPDKLTANDKKILDKGGAVAEYWVSDSKKTKSDENQLGLKGQSFRKGGRTYKKQSLLDPKVLIQMADRRISLYRRTKAQPDRMLQLGGKTIFSKEDNRKKPKITKVKIEKGQLEEGVERYSIDGRQVFIIKDKRDGRYYYTIGSRPSTDNIGVAMDATVKTPLQAKNFIVGQVNNLNKGLKLAPLSLLIGKARDAYGQETQQAVGIEAVERGQTFAATPTSSQAVEEGRKETPSVDVRIVEADEEGKAEDVETRGRWRSKVQPSEPMPQVEGVERQDPNEPASYKTGREMPKGFVLERGILIPAAKQFDNDFRASVGLPPVTKQGGRYALPSSPLELTEEQRDPQSVPVVGQRYTEIMEGSRDEGTPLEERLAQTDLPPAAAESEIDLSEEEFNAVKAHTDSFNGGVTGFINSIVDEVFDKNPVLFAQLQKLALTAQKAATKFVADARKRAEEMDVSTLEGRTQRKKLLDRAAILEAGMPYDFKSVLNEQGRRILISWAKSVSPNNHKAVLEYAEDIFRAAETNKKLRAKAKKSDSENLQVPTDLPTAKGAVALKELIARPDNGLTEEQRLAALRFLDQIAPELLENLSLNISAELNAEGDTEVAYEGEFNSLENLINLASDTNTDENTLLEEIAHFTAKLLPSDLRSQAIKLHKKALGDEIAKNEKALSRAQGDDRVRILSNLNVLRAIQSRGQLTSEEFRNILPRESEVGSDTFERIIEDTYHLANADEFYANAMVTRAGESEFSRARQFLNSILDAIAAAFGNTNAQVNRFVSNAKRSLATPGKANKRMGGMLMRGNVNAKSMKVLTNPGKLAGATATDLQRADQARAMGNEADAEKYKQRADDRVAQAGGVVSLFERVIRKVVPTLDTGGRVAQLLKFRDLGYVTNLVDSLPSSSEYKQTIQRFMEDGKPELAQATALYAYQFILEMENRAKALRLKADEKLKRINTDTFKDNVRRAIENEKKDNRTAIINSEIVKSLQNALVDATSTGPTLNMLAQMIGSVENLEAAVSTVPELNKAIATLTNILSKEEAGIELFNRPDISDQFHDSGEIVRLSNEIFEFVKNLGVRVEDENLWRTASALFVANRSIRTNSIIESMPFIEAKKNSTAKIKEILDAINSGDEATRRQKIAEIFQEVVDLSTEEGKAKYVTQQRMGSVVKEIRDAAIYEEAAAAAEAVVNDPEITEFRRLTALQAKVDDRPELVENHFYEDFSNGSIYIPKPPNKLNPEGDNVVKINVISGGKGNENIKKANEAAKDIQEWLEENMEDGKPTSPYWEYYWNTLQQLHTTFINDLIWNTPTNQRTLLRNTFFGVLGHMVDNIPTRGAKIARRFIDKHDMYYTWFDDWRARHKAKWTNLLLLAAKSRKGRFADDVKFFKLRESKEAQKIRGVAEWEKNVGRYLRDSWQEGGMNYGVGEVLPNGEIVTKEDMALLEYEDMMTDEAYQFNGKIAEQDESTQPFRVTDAAVKGRSIKRLALRRGKAMLPRRFSGDGRSFIDQYQLQVNAGKTGKALFDEIFAGEEGTQALISFISDRNPEWVTASGIDASINEGIYSMVSEEIRDGSLLETYNETELTAQLIASRLAEAAGVGVETGTAEVPSIKEQLMQEFAPVLDNLAGKFDKENNNKNPFLQISTTEGISSLTEGRRDKIAPSFFYTYGFNNEQQFQSFVSQGQLPAAQGVISALKSAQTEIGQLINTSQLDALAKKYMNQLGKKGKKADRYSRKVQKAIAKELGIKIVSDNSVQFQLTKQYENLGQYIRDFEEVYGSAGGSDYSVDSLPNLAQRAWGITVGSLLANPMTTIRNYTDTLINGALAVQMIQGGTGIMPIIHTILRSLMVSVIKGGGSFIVSGAKIATYKLPIVGTWKAVKRGTGIDGHPPSLYGAIRALLTPTIEELAETLPSRTREYEMLRRQGLGMPTTPEQTSINFDELLETGGRVLSPMQAEESSKLNPAKALFWRGLGKGIGAWEAGLNVLLRPLMQRMGDVAANNLLANLAAHVGHTMQRKAKLAYANRIKQGINLDETLEPEELLGNFMGLLKQNGTTYNEALTFLSKAGITNLEQQVKDYWQRLASAPDKASRNQEKLFTQSQLDRMAAVLVMSNNIATPSNRPLWMKKSRLNSIMFALTGWSFNQLQNWMKATAATGGESGREQAKRRVQMLMLILAPIAFGIPDNWILEWLMRGVDEGLYGRRRITRLPNETAGWQQDGIQWDESKAVLSLATQSVPLLGSSLNAYWNDLPGRAQHTPAGLVTGQIGAAVDFFVNGKSTGNLEQTGIAAINRLLPISRAVTYRVSKWQKAKTKNDNARRAIRATYSDAKAIRPITGGAMGYVPDEFTPLKEMWAAAVADGDWAEARRLYDEGIDTYRYVREEATGRKISREQAERNMKSSLSTANPVAKALQYKPDRKTFYENIAHATEKDAGTIRSNLKNWEEAHRIFDLTSIFASGSSKSKRPVVRRSINRINRRTSGRSALRQR